MDHHDDRSDGPGTRSIAREHSPSWIEAPATMLLFWSAIVTPVLYLTLLLTGIESTSELLLFLGLLALHVVSLFGGRSYRRHSSR